MNNGGPKKSGKICKIVATFVSASSQGQRTHSARTKIVATFVYASTADLQFQQKVTDYCQSELPIMPLIQDYEKKSHRKNKSLALRVTKSTILGVVHLSYTN